MKQKRILDKSFKEYFWARVKVGKKNECWPWLKSVNRGYGGCRISGKKKESRRGSHRIAYELHTRHNPGKSLVLHKCDNRVCCNPHHLFLGTTQDNRRDCVDKERHARGELNGGAKLAENEVIIIYQSYWGGIKCVGELVKEFNVEVTTIKNIISNRTWGHLKLFVDKNKILICNKCRKEFNKPRSLNYHKLNFCKKDGPK
jgi:hypothetical protein